MLVANSPLFIEDLSGHHSEAQRGSVLKRRIVVKNLGDRAAEVDVWIVATNKASQTLLRWCTFSEPNPIKLQPHENREVILQFEIPHQASPEVYSYEILVDAQAQYPDQPPLRRPQQLRVLPSSQDAEWGSEPTFTLQPTTNSANPYSLQAEACLEVQVKVKNCSKRVDRYYLTCPELSQDWFTVQYPESNLDTPGLVRETDGLELNPDCTGEILLQLHPPQYTPAGRYFPTVRLTSSNKEGLVLLDIVYLEILPDARLEAQIRPVSRRIPTEPGLFTIELTNQGNLERTLTLQASDRAHLFNYALMPSEVHLAPGNVAQIQLVTAPRQRWRRPLWGKGWHCPIDLEIQDRVLPQTTNTTNIAIAQLQDLHATVVWEAWPWWVPFLLVLAGLGAIGALAYLLWGIVFKPGPDTTPKIVQFGSTINPATKQQRTYRQEDSAIYLNWQISQLKNVEKVTIIRLDKGFASERKSYVFSGRIPKELQHKQTGSYCKITKTANTEGLSCIAMPFPIKEPGEYTFQLQVFTAQNLNQPTDAITTDTISVTPAPLPQIVNFAPTQPTYRASRTPDFSGLIRLNWEVSHASQIQELKLVGLAPDGSMTTVLKRYRITGNSLPPELSPFCNLSTNLVCRNVPTTARMAGEYLFKLAIAPKQNSGAEIEQQTPVIKIQAPPPKILSFQLNGQEVNQKPKYVYEMNKHRAPVNVVLSWQVEQGDGVKVELLPAPGVVSLKGTLQYPLSKPPSRETLTLRATNRLGEQVSRTIVLETVEPRQTTLAPAIVPSTSSKVSDISPNRLTLPSTKLQPLELPPKPGIN